MGVIAPNRKEGKLEVNVEARKYCAYVLHITANNKNFPLEQNDINSMIRDTALDIYTSCWEANNIRVDNDKERYNERIRLQRHAHDKCNAMMALIELAVPLYHMPNKRCIYWMNQTKALRNKIAAWNKSDEARLKPE